MLRSPEVRPTPSEGCIRSKDTLLIRTEENVCENNVDVDPYEHLLKDGVDFTRH